MPVDKIGRLALACPVPVRTQSFDGQPVSVGFDLPSAAGGQAPVSVGCTPAPGHGFDIGVTEVACSASDALGQTAACAFSVTVLGPPRLSATRFLAFGDSLTAGWVSSPASRARPEPTAAYPYLLQRDLQSRYVTQTIEVINAAAPGEDARDAPGRFRSVVASERPEVIVLWEGTNDLNTVTGGGIETAAAALDTMVVHGQSRGADVLIMTVPPALRLGVQESVPLLNDEIAAIAARRDIVLIDAHAVIAYGACPGGGTMPCLGADGLHPTAEGYRLVADEVARVLVERYDVEIVAPAADPAAVGFPPGMRSAALPPPAGFPPGAGE